MGFACHQAAEKALKAAVVFARSASPPKIDALMELAKRAELRDRMTEAQRALLDALDPLNTETRYPAERRLLLASLTNERCQELVAATEELVTWIRAQLSRA